MVLYSNEIGIDLSAIVLYVSHFTQADKDDQTEYLREHLVVHDGDSFKYLFVSEDSDVITYDADGRTYKRFTIRRIDGWPVKLITRFTGIASDGTGVAV